MINIKLFLTLAIVLQVFSIFSSTYYVATNGKDSNAGSMTSPFLTCSRAQQVIAVGGAVNRSRVTHKSNSPQIASTEITNGYASVGEIQIDQSSKALIAPEAHAYQWYRNGIPMEGEMNRSIAIRNDGNYEVESIDMLGNTSTTKISVAISAAGTIIKIILLGDSTVANWASNYYPETGWGQVLQYYFNSANVQVANYAKSGTTTVSFYNSSSCWKAASKVIAAGDYVLIQFGHNDQKDATIDPYGVYQQYLTKYVTETRAKGGIPVFVTSVNRNMWNGTKFDSTTLGKYPDAMRKLGVSLKVPVIDLNARSAKLFASLGQKYLSDYIFNNYPAGEYPNYPKGHTDHTHFREMGAIEVSRLVIDGIKASSVASMKALIPFLKPVYTVTVAANPSSSASMITRTASYPSGMKITLKSTPKTAGTFLRWNNASGTSVATTILYSFAMPAASTSYSAIYTNFKSLTIDTGIIRSDAATEVFPNPTNTYFEVSTPQDIEKLSVLNETGILVYNKSGIKAGESLLIGESFTRGVYLMVIHFQNGKKEFKKIIKTY